MPVYNPDVDIYHGGYRFYNAMQPTGIPGPEYASSSSSGSSDSSDSSSSSLGLTSSSSSKGITSSSSSTSSSLGITSSSSSSTSSEGITSSSSSSLGITSSTSSEGITSSSSSSLGITSSTSSEGITSSSSSSLGITSSSSSLGITSSSSSSSGDEWGPDLIDTLAWYDASDANTITEISGSVSQIDDKSGNDYHLKQGSAGNQPSWGLGAQINGLNVLHFDSTSDYIETLLVPATEETSELAVISICEAKVDGDYPNCGTIKNTDGSDIIDLRCKMDNDGLAGQLSASVKVDNVGAGITTGSTSALQDDVPFIISGWYDGTNGTVRIDGGTLSGSNSPTAGATFSPSYIRMGRTSNTPKNYHGEMIVLQTADLATIQKCEGYLAWKWGTVARLEASHPYKSAPPEGPVVASSDSSELLLTSSSSTENSNSSSSSGDNWTPSDITTQVWYDAADIDTITSSGYLVSQWDDKSGNGYTASQADPVKKPSTGIRTLNGLNVLDCQSGLSLLQTGAVSYDTGAFTAFIVYDADSGTTMLSHNGGSEAWNINRANVSFQQISAIDIDPDLSGPSLVALKSDKYVANQVTAYVNGTQEGTSALGTETGIGGGAAFRINANFVGGSNADGGLAEIIVVNDITDFGRQRIEGYLAWKWGLVSKLPGDHPYKSAPPQGELLFAVTEGGSNLTDNGDIVTDGYTP